jgi:hypothetical protein
VGRWATEPTGVSLNGDVVQVGGDNGLPHLSDEDAVNRSPVSAWYYDAAARRLIVKVVPATRP